MGRVVHSCRHRCHIRVVQPACTGVEINRQEIGAEPLLSRQEETALARTIEAGLLAREERTSSTRRSGASDAELAELERLGEMARDRYLRANLRLVAMVAAADTARTGVAEAELFQEGCLALIQALQRFDYTRGCKFATYALPWIRAFVAAASARRCGELNLPTSRAIEQRPMHGLQAELAQTLRRLPSVAELARASGRSSDWVARVMAYEGPQALGEAAEPDDPDAAAAFDEVLDDPRLTDQLLARLPPLVRAVISYRFGFDDGQFHGYTATARRLGLTVTHVRRSEEQALALLRAQVS